MVVASARARTTCAATLARAMLASAPTRSCSLLRQRPRAAPSVRRVGRIRGPVESAVDDQTLLFPPIGERRRRHPRLDEAIENTEPFARVPDDRAGVLHQPSRPRRRAHGVDGVLCHSATHVGWRALAGAEQGDDRIGLGHCGAHHSGVEHITLEGEHLVTGCGQLRHDDGTKAVNVLR